MRKRVEKKEGLGLGDKAMALYPNPKNENFVNLLLRVFKLYGFQYHFITTSLI
jgi:hypothetical protein